MISHNASSFGLGGLLRDTHVKELLRRKGQDMTASKMMGGGTLMQQQPLVAPATNRYRKRLRRDDAAKISHRDSTPWLHRLGISPHPIKTKERQEVLVKQFEGKPTDYAFEME
mmetsp:Transcript_27082/g.74681  ORF Transcript_27082/g.74681 Transcript_27082/m.74681 type:complete len:113 (+) Transcript_27082:1060-1398(+)